jgi:hypothetical protein
LEIPAPLIIFVENRGEWNSMKHILVYIWILLLYPGLLSAQNTVPSDRELLEALYSQSMRALLTESSPETGRMLLPSFANGFAPSERTRTVTETILSALGYSIPDSVREGACGLTVMITDARCTLKRTGRYYERFLSLTLHVRCTDHSGATVFARGCERTSRDRISRTELGITDTGSQFSPEFQRSVLDQKPNIARILSFLTVSAALGFFALRK